MGPSPILSQPRVVHDHHVLMTHQYGLVQGQQLNNLAAGRASIYGPGYVASRQGEQSLGFVALGAALQSARNAPAPLRVHDLSWTLAQPAQDSAVQPGTGERQGCIVAALEMCCNIWGCGTVGVLD